MITISIIIRVKNEEKTIGKLIEQILCQKIEKKYEVLVIDDCSADNTSSIVARYPVRLLRLKPKQFTFGYALNLGAKMARGKILVNLSADCLLIDDNWLRKLTSLLLKNKAIATYGRQIPVSGENPFEEPTLEVWYPPTEEIVTRKAFSNANCAIKKNVWQRFPFNEEIVSMEDWLWYEQVKKFGNIEYVPEAAVYHSHPISRFIRLYHRVKRDGVATVYLKKYYDIDVRVRRKSLTSIRSFITAPLIYILYISFFLIKKGYYRSLFAFPFYQLIHDIAYYKGIQEGKKRYGVFK